MAGAMVLLDKHHRQRSASCRLAYAAMETYTVLVHLDTQNEARDAIYQLEGMEHSSRLKLYVLAVQLHQPERCNYQYQGCWSNRHHTLFEQDFITLNYVSQPRYVEHQVFHGDILPVKSNPPRHCWLQTWAPKEASWQMSTGICILN